MAGYFNPYYQQPQYYQPMQQSQSYQQPMQQQQTLPQPQIQNGGFVSVRNETEARNYPVAPGNSITFKDETSPYIYTKTMGFSQLDRPIFNRYRLVQEEDTAISQEAVKSNGNEFKHDIEWLKEQVETLRGDLDVLKEQAKKPASRKKDDSIGGGD